MLEHYLDTVHSILYVHPTSSLEEEDFIQLAATVDPYIGKTGVLAGIIIESPTFPGWKTFGAIVSHFRFMRDHHKHVRKIALVTDSALGNVAEHLASHFVAAEIRQFPSGEIETAKQWIISSL